jgi:hypothetical protein
MWPRIAGGAPTDGWGTRMSDVVVGVLMAILGVTGLFMAAGALDDEIYIFGLSLAGLALAFDFGLVKAYFDRKDAAAIAAREAGR